MKILKQALIYIYNNIEKIIFPQCCLICGKIVNSIICKKCEKNLKYKQNIIIINNKNSNIKTQIHLFPYKDEIRKLIINYKFNDKPYLYKIFSKIIIENKKICRILKKYDIIIPVPIHHIRKIKRGYNQSEVISRHIAENIENIKIENNIVIKVKNTIAQSLLNKEERKNNIKKAYQIKNKQKIQNKNIIIFDDIYTTGNTVREIAKLLKENGADKILVLTIAKD